MKRTLRHGITLLLIAAFAFLALGSDDATTSAASGVGVYTLVNRSSHTVEVYNSLGAYVTSIRPGYQQNVSTGLIGNIYTFWIIPADLVNLTISGSTVTFVNR